MWLLGERAFDAWVMPPLLPLPRAYKKIELEDLRFPLVCGEGKKVNSMIEVGEGRRTHHKLSREVEVLPEGRAGVGGSTVSESLGEGYSSIPASFPLGASDGHHWGDPGLRRPQPQGLQFHPAYQALPVLLP